MPEETQKREYRALTIGNIFSAKKDESIEETLDETGMDGWEAISDYPL